MKSHANLRALSTNQSHSQIAIFLGTKKSFVFKARHHDYSRQLHVFCDSPVSTEQRRPYHDALLSTKLPELLLLNPLRCRTGSGPTSRPSVSHMLNQQNSASFCMARMSQEWLTENVHNNVTRLWPLSSPNLNPLNKPTSEHTIIGSLEVTNMENHWNRPCSQFQDCIQYVF